ncbi:MAG TPA: hypothetical protein VN259_06425 [Xanthomonadales bacterium]|nr:hypothetical protein [Xanthomonadales bacterium]
MSRLLLLLLLLTLTLGANEAPAAGAPKYAVRYSVQFLPGAGAAAIDISTQPETGRLVAMDLNMPRAVYSGESGDGSVVRDGDRVVWTPPRTGGHLRYRVLIDQRRANGEFDSRITPDFVITRGDHLFPPAQIRATKGSGSTAILHFDLPKGWDDVETPFSKVGSGDFAVTNAERKFDRPIGWIAAGKLTSSRETIAGMRVTVTAPSGEIADQLATLAILRQALPEMLDAFGELPEKLLIVRSGNPMWRGGLSAPGSLWLHAERPLLSQNGTSPILHELTHVISDIRGGVQDDWIAEGLAEFYSLEFGRRSGLISDDRFAKAIRSANRSGAKVATLRGAESTTDRTRKAVALFAKLDAELRAGGSGIDALTVQLMRHETVTLDQLRADARKLLGRASTVLAGVV